MARCAPGRTSRKCRRTALQFVANLKLDNITGHRGACRKLYRLDEHEGMIGITHGDEQMDRRHERSETAEAEPWTPATAASLQLYLRIRDRTGTAGSSTICR